jgi:hypothetical protein
MTWRQPPGTFVGYLLISLSAFLSSSAQAAGFDCNKVTQSVELNIAYRQARSRNLLTQNVYGNSSTSG